MASTVLLPPLLPLSSSSPHSSNHRNVQNQNNLRHFIKHLSCMPHLKQTHALYLKTTSSIPPYFAIYLYSRLVAFAACSDLSYASRLLDHSPYPPNTFMYNTLIRSYARSPNLKHLSLSLFSQMLLNSQFPPDRFTIPFVLKACAFLFTLSVGQQIHSYSVKLGLVSDTHVCNSLIHFYASCGRLTDARHVFDNIPERNVVSWNVVIDAYAQWGEFDTAIALFRQMQVELFLPDGFTIQSVLTACAGLGAVSLGMWAHVFLMRKCGDEVVEDVLIKNSLIDMYMKCGSVDMACGLFEGMSERDVASWNALILGLAMHGCVGEALSAFARLCSTGNLKPNSITFIGVLSGCKHGGLVSEAIRLFDAMVKEYGIEPEIEHYGCMVDLLCRAGKIKEALDLLSVMPMKPDVVIWRTLLDGCCKQNASIDISEAVAKQALESEGGVSSGVYVLLSRMYALADRWNDVGIVRSVMDDIGIKKEPGCSSIEIDGVVHEFMAGDTSHPLSKEIYETLEVVEDRLTSVGYKPDISQAPMIAEVSSRKQQSLRLHSERLATAFGLLNVRQGMPIRIMKNLRVCTDCHTVTKLISRIFNVEIIVRDRVRFHRFKDGLCSCMDYW